MTRDRSAVRRDNKDLPRSPDTALEGPAPQVVTGVFEPNGTQGGHLRNPDTGFDPRPGDLVVPARLCRECNLRGGETITGKRQPGSTTQHSRNRELAEVTSINDVSIEDHMDVKPFEKLIAIDPQQRMHFETPGGPLTMRVVDLMTPIGLGQRGLIVAPPRTGKTVLLQHMADGVATNHPDVHIMMLLIDERPEEVTHLKRSIRGEVIASSNDRSIANHLRLSRLVVSRAKRLVEHGKDVLILLDSLTRLGRAFNAGIRGSGRIMSGGLDIQALTEPKSIFGAARNVEDGGSLTIIASALIETGSRMDDVIFNEFKGTGNMEIMLSRTMADRRLWPAIDLQVSGTRKEELLLTSEELPVAHHLRRSLAGGDPVRAMETLLEALGKHPTNAAFVENYSPNRLPSGRRIF